jgi:hypothetical protein
MPDINLRVQIEGVDNLLHGFQRVITNIAPAMVALEKRLIKRLSTYPAPPPNSTYDRTGNLGAAWAEGAGAVSVDALGTNLYQDRASIELHNDVTSPSGQHYAGWVQDPEMQARVHQGRWQTTDKAIDAETGLFLEDVVDAVERTFY